MYRYTRQLLVFIFLAFISCEKEEVPTEYDVPDNFLVYVDSFFEEALARGVELKKENLIIRFNSEITKELCGQCRKPKRNKAGQRIVEIKDSPDCWEYVHELNREALIFHELAHCLLNRGSHKDDLFSDGSPKSIMTTIIDGPYEPCGYDIGGNNGQGGCNKTARRTYYLDELFNENIEVVPDWVNQ